MCGAIKSRATGTTETRWFAVAHNGDVTPIPRKFPAQKYTAYPAKIRGELSHFAVGITRRTLGLVEYLLGEILYVYTHARVYANITEYSSTHLSLAFFRIASDYLLRVLKVLERSNISHEIPVLLNIENNEFWDYGSVWVNNNLFYQEWIRPYLSYSLRDRAVELANRVLISNLYIARDVCLMLRIKKLW